ncbi:hypothetical protein V5E97_12950 [Singulisphaera sp. Ch08]|uniref:Uncharacterized protein n=1 Tax=Singulisphaera sp. Ch08 TaxID=3120278 RepID=A0AAU7CPJ1_9BACT
MPVRKTSTVAMTVVVESVGGGLSPGDAVTKTTTTVGAHTDVANVTNGADCTVHLDFEISRHEIFYGDRKTADSTSDKETRTVRQHEYGHVGARNALADKSLLTSLCSDVGVKWKFHIASTGNLGADQAKLDATTLAFESAVEDYINLFIDYLDELVVHETQRKASKTGRPTDSQLATKLAAISYTDPETGTLKQPSSKVVAQAVKATQAGSTKGEEHAKKTPTPTM